MCIVGGISIYGSLSFVSFYSQPFYAIAILAFVIAIALLVKPLITKRTTIWFWLAASPLALFVCSSFGVLTTNYILDRGKEPVVWITFKGFEGSITPTAAKFYIDASLINNSAYKATLERVTYEVYCWGDHLCSAEITDAITIEEKKTWSDNVEIVSDNFSQETAAFLYESLEVKQGALPLQIRGSVRLRFGSTICEKPFEVDYLAHSRGPGWSIELEDFVNCNYKCHALPNKRY